MSNINNTEFDIELSDIEELKYIPYLRLSYSAQELDDIIQIFELYHPSVRYLVIDDSYFDKLSPDIAYELSCNGYDIFCEYSINGSRELLSTMVTIDLQTSEPSFGHPGSLAVFEYYE